MVGARHGGAKRRLRIAPEIAHPGIAVVPEREQVGPHHLAHRKDAQIVDAIADLLPVIVSAGKPKRSFDPGAIVKAKDNECFSKTTRRAIRAWLPTPRSCRTPG